MLYAATAIYTARESDGLHYFVVRHETALGPDARLLQEHPREAEMAAFVRFAGVELGAFLP
jgi:hypothetical protein